MDNTRQIIKYVFSDWLTAAISWTLFFVYRKITEYRVFQGAADKLDFSIIIPDVLNDRIFIISIIIIPFFWLIAYFLSGYYRRVYFKSRLEELWQTFFMVVLGTVLLFFLVILDDYISSYKSYYQSFIVLFSIQFVLTYIARLIITTATVKRIHRKKIGIKTLIIGDNDNAINIYEKINFQKKFYVGNLFVGFVNVFEKSEYKLSKYLPRLGTYKNLSAIVNKYNIQEVIIAFERSEVGIINEVNEMLDATMVNVKIIPDMQDLAFGKIRQLNIWHEPLLQLTPEPMPYWQQSVKRIFDIVFSVLAILILSPLYIFTAIMVKRSSPGPVFYKQERIGKMGRPFNMLKFRSMYVDAEHLGPQLSSDQDSRITPWGRIMRKVRLDEIPQFFTVLKGDMSIVGYRPERQYFIDKIVQKAPYYRKLLRINPGITSWGEVKFGYAENVDEMVERLKYDILYIENMSLLLDAKILIYTVLIVIQGRGK